MGHARALATRSACATRSTGAKTRRCCGMEREHRGRPNGPGTKFPVQFGQTPCSTISAQAAHHVHSYVQMRASGLSGGKVDVAVLTGRSEVEHDDHRAHLNLPVSTVSPVPTPFIPWPAIVKVSDDTVAPWRRTRRTKEGARRAGHAGVHLAGKQRVVFSPKSVLIAVNGDHGAMRIRNKAIPVDVVERGLEAGPLTLGPTRAGSRSETCCTTSAGRSSRGIRDSGAVQTPLISRSARIPCRAPPGTVGGSHNGTRRRPGEAEGADEGRYLASMVYARSVTRRWLTVVAHVYRGRRFRHPSAGTPVGYALRQKWAHRSASSCSRCGPRSVRALGAPAGSHGSPRAPTARSRSPATRWHAADRAPGDTPRGGTRRPRCRHGRACPLCPCVEVPRPVRRDRRDCITLRARGCRERLGERAHASAGSGSSTVSGGPDADMLTGRESLTQSNVGARSLRATGRRTHRRRRR